MSLSSSYSFQQYKVVQDLVYEDLGGDFQVARNLPAEQKAHIITFAAHYYPSELLYLLFEVTSTRAKGEFTLSTADLLQPVSIGSFSQMEQHYLIFHLGSEYKLSETLDLGLDYRFGDFEDTINNIYDDIEDGEAHIVTISATKKW